MGIREREKLKLGAMAISSLYAISDCARYLTNHFRE
jgi:hypothetical protein